ncbi:MAG: response regulator transcription factor [Lachnospiraceae bacterium]
MGNTTNHDFTYRELEILREVTTGDSNATIGARMGISANTIRNAIRAMMEKPGFKSRTELAVEARRLGIVIKEKSGTKF